MFYFLLLSLSFALYVMRLLPSIAASSLLAEETFQRRLVDYQDGDGQQLVALLQLWQ